MTDTSSINRVALSNAAMLVRPALATQAYLPALTHILFSGGWATAYNDISAISVRSPLDLDRCIPGDLMIRALGSFSGETIAFQEGKDGAIVMSSGRSKVKLPTMEVKDFPFKLPTDDAPEIDIDHSILKGITRCLLSVSNDPTHPAQRGVTLDIDDKKQAVLFSTDGFSISRFQTKSKVKLPGDAPVILPTFFCEQLVALSKAFPDDDMLLVLLPGALLVEIGKSARLFTKTLLDLEPLDFARKIEQTCPLDGIKEDLAAIPDSFDAALGRALLVLSGEVDKLTEITVGDGVLRLASTSPMGDANDSMSYDTRNDPPPPFFMDPSLVMRAAKVCTLIGFEKRVLVLADDETQFIHLIGHCSK